MREEMRQGNVRLKSCVFGTLIFGLFHALE